jgi:enamine deaminase RidA (YjgF/YER057c/UK114 family)
MRPESLVVVLTLSLTACAPVTQRQVVNPPGISPLVPAYSVAIRQGNMVFASGMIGIKPGTLNVIEGGVAVPGYELCLHCRATGSCNTGGLGAAEA